MDALGAKKLMCCRFAKRLRDEDIGPWSCRQQCGLGANIEMGIADEIVPLRALDNAVADQQSIGCNMVRRGRAMCHRIEDAFESETFRRIHLRVVVKERTLEAWSRQ